MSFRFTCKSDRGEAEHARTDRQTDRSRRNLPMLLAGAMHRTDPVSMQSRVKRRLIKKNKNTLDTQPENHHHSHK